jgi:protein-L-isoaspartate(D-aspartate) O-methyltransferase
MKNRPTSILFSSLLIFIATVLSIHSFAHAAKLTDNDFQKQRLSMVNDQIMERGVKDRSVIKAMTAVPRHKFVSENYLNRAYDDGPLPIGYGQTISQPYIVAYMTEILNLNKNSRVLEVGTGSGY